MCTCEDANSGYLAGSRPAAWSRGPTRDLNVDAENITGATALYEQVGMRVINRWDVRERALEETQEICLVCELALMVLEMFLASSSLDERVAREDACLP